MFRLAHLSDPHLAPLPPARITELASKRLLGFLNWHLHRGRGIMQAGSLDAILADIAGTAPDHVAVTGDLVNIALPMEFEAAKAFLARIGSSAFVSLVPGNHDAYVPGALVRARSAWGPHMQGDDTSRPAFPYVRQREPVAIIGVSSAKATGPFMATGVVGADQAARLRNLLVELGREGLARVVLIHHPPIDSETTWKSRLVDAARFRAVIASAGAELILHGHTHRASLNWIAGADKPVPVVGVQAASLQVSAEKRGASWNLFEIDGSPGSWTITRIERGFARGQDTVTEISRAALVPA